MLASFALRGEHDADFGNSLAGRYDVTKAFALRGALQNGLRAPSPRQQHFTSTSTNFISGMPFEISTFRPSDAVVIALGARPLEAEKSVNLSFGAVLRLDTVSITVDAYKIDIKNRIVLSENLTAANVRDTLRRSATARHDGCARHTNTYQQVTRLFARDCHGVW